MRDSAALPEGTSIDRLLMLPWEYTHEKLEGLDTWNDSRAKGENSGIITRRAILASPKKRFFMKNWVVKYICVITFEVARRVTLFANKMLPDVHNMQTRLEYIIKQQQQLKKKKGNKL